MSIDLSTGSNSYVSLGNGVDIRTTLPITLAVCFNSGGIGSGLLGLFSQGQNVANRGWGAFVYGASPKNGGNYRSRAVGGTAEFDGTQSFIQSDHGWYLLVMNFSEDGLADHTTLGMYSYTDAAWATFENAAIAVTGLVAPSASDPALVGALNISGAPQDFLLCKLSWAAAWANDFNGILMSGSDPRLVDLVANGPWGTVVNDYTWFIPFTNAAIDQGSSHHDGSIIGGATYAEAGPGELPPTPPIPPSPPISIGHPAGGVVSSEGFGEWLSTRPWMGRLRQPRKPDPVAVIEPEVKEIDALKENNNRAALAVALMALDDE